MESGETPEACLRRELFEELGIRAEVVDLYHQQHYIYPDCGSYDVLYYMVPFFSGKIVNHVFESLRWAAIPTLQEYDILEGNREVVERLVREDAEAGSTKG